MLAPGCKFKVDVNKLEAYWNAIPIPFNFTEIFCVFDTFKSVAFSTMLGVVSDVFWEIGSTTVIIGAIQFW